MWALVYEALGFVGVSPGCADRREAVQSQGAAWKSHVSADTCHGPAMAMGTDEIGHTVAGMWMNDARNGLLCLDGGMCSNGLFDGVHYL